MAHSKLYLLLHNPTNSHKVIKVTFNTISHLQVVTTVPATMN